MTDILDIILPVFCLVALGYLLAAARILPQASGDALSDFVFRIGVPLLLVRSIATAEFSGAGPVAVAGFWVAYFTGILVVWVAAWWLISRGFDRGLRASTIAGVAAGFSNLVLLGIPLVERAYGEAGLEILFLLIAIHLPIMMSVSTFLMEYAVRADGADHTPIRPLGVLRELIRNLLFNPIIVGIGAGLIWRFSGLGYGGVPGQVIDLVARTTGPLALISLGLGLVKFGIRGNIGPAAGLALLSLVIMPAVVFAMAHVLSLPPLWLQVAVIAAACPTGVNAYLFATHFKIAEGLSSNTIVIAMLGSVFTLPLWLSLVGS